MNPFEMVAIIVVAVMIASVLRSRHGHRRRDGSQSTTDERVESARLKDEVTQLKERIKVLERIAVEKEDTLTREIDQLRDR